MGVYQKLVKQWGVSASPDGRWWKLCDLLEQLEGLYDEKQPRLAPIELKCRAELLEKLSEILKSIGAPNAAERLSRLKRKMAADVIRGHSRYAWSLNDPYRMERIEAIFSEYGEARSALRGVRDERLPAEPTAAIGLARKRLGSLRSLRKRARPEAYRDREMEVLEWLYLLRTREAFPKLDMLPLEFETLRTLDFSDWLRGPQQTDAKLRFIYGQLGKRAERDKCLREARVHASTLGLHGLLLAGQVGLRDQTKKIDILYTFTDPAECEDWERVEHWEQCPSGLRAREPANWLVLKQPLAPRRPHAVSVWYERHTPHAGVQVELVEGAAEAASLTQGYLRLLEGEDLAGSEHARFAYKELPASRRSSARYLAIIVKGGDISLGRVCLHLQMPSRDA